MLSQRLRLSVFDIELLEIFHCEERNKKMEAEKKWYEKHRILISDNANDCWFLAINFSKKPRNVSKKKREQMLSEWKIYW